MKLEQGVRFWITGAGKEEMRGRAERWDKKQLRKPDACESLGHLLGSTEECITGSYSGRFLAREGGEARFSVAVISLCSLSHLKSGQKLYSLPANPLPESTWEAITVFLKVSHCCERAVWENVMKSGKYPWTELSKRWCTQNRGGQIF